MGPAVVARAQNKFKDYENLPPEENRLEFVLMFGNFQGGVYLFHRRNLFLFKKLLKM